MNCSSTPTYRSINTALFLKTHEQKVSEKTNVLIGLTGLTAQGWGSCASPAAIFKPLPPRRQCHYRHLISQHHLFPGSTDLHTHEPETSLAAGKPGRGEGRTELTVSPFSTKGRKALISSTQLQRKEIQSAWSPGLSTDWRNRGRIYFMDFVVIVIFNYCLVAYYCISKCNILLCISTLSIIAGFTQLSNHDKN